MLILGCAGNHNYWTNEYSLLDKVILWFQNQGIPQEALIFTFVLMTIAAMKGYLLRRLGWGDSVSTFVVPALATAVSLGAGIGCFGLRAATDPMALVVFGVVAVLIEGLVWTLHRGLLSSKQWRQLASVNGAALVWLWILKVPSLFVYVIPNWVQF